MNFQIRLGVPEIENLWNELIGKVERGKISINEKKVLKKLSKTFNLLSVNPKHNSLNTHEIEQLSKRYGIKVWQSYLENRKPAAGRIFWVYGPNIKDITIIGIEPHPEDSKRKGYDKVKLSKLP